MLVVAAYSLFPFVWALIVSFSDPGQGSLLSRFTLVHYQTILNFEDETYAIFFRSIFNSIVVCGAVTALSLFLGALAAYALGRYRFRGQYLLRYVILAMTIFPTIAVLPSLLIRIKSLNAPSDMLELSLVYPLFILPGIIWYLIAFFELLPPQIEEAAFVDGATPFQTFVRILLPITLPAIVTQGLLNFLALLNEYLFALSFKGNPLEVLVPVALADLRGAGATNNELMAASIIVTIPILLIVLFLQRAIIGETTQGAVKG
ncbi:MAG: carbohydrate ABC transporter permease [Chloroflexota bacterium]